MAREGFSGLADAYRDLLARASRVGRSDEEDPLADFAGHDDVPPLVRRMVSAHVRGRLNELALACAQGAAAKRMTDDSEWTWLDEAREDCERVAGNLPSLRVRPAALVPFALPLIGLLGKHFSGWGSAVVSALVATTLAVAFAGYLAIRDSYRAKRELLLPGALELDRRD